jgi:hypothetical protein
VSVRSTGDWVSINNSLKKANVIGLQAAAVWALGVPDDSELR